MSKVNFKIEDNQLKVGLDADQDGVNSLNLKVELSEAFKEAFNKGTAVEGIKSASIKFQDGKLVAVIDTDKDGVAALTLELNLPEGIKETGVLK